MQLLSNSPGHPEGHLPFERDRGKEMEMREVRSYVVETIARDARFPYGHG